jgi:hypothetical protein
MMLRQEWNMSQDKPSQGWWKEEGIARELSHCFADHILPLQVHALVDGKESHGVYTGFLLRVDQHYLWITAGHVAEAIKALQENPTVKILRAWLSDREDDPAKSRVPVDVSDTVIFSAQPHLDLGLVVFRQGYLAPILNNPRFRPLTPESWFKRGDPEPEAFYIAGVPSEWVEFSDLGQDSEKLRRGSRFTLACVPVERIRRESNSEPRGFWSHTDDFYGTLSPVHDDEGVDLTSIKGISGGPLFAVARPVGNTFRYWVYGIQSEWLPDSRIIRAVPIWQAGQIIANLISIVTSKMKSR